MDDLFDKLAHRFGRPPPRPREKLPADSALQTLAAHRSCRDFRPDTVSDELVETLSALALCAPTKSDLQQRDIVMVRDAGSRARLDRLLGGGWVERAPVLLVFCGNNRRQRQLHEWRGRPFANDHLDAFFNAAVDAGIVLSSFVIAAEAIGLGTCPLSAIRNHAGAASDLLGLPDWVFPVAGLALGWPASEGEMSLRLPLAATLHVDRFIDDGIETAIGAYDARRAAIQPPGRQRDTEAFGETPDYGWSEDKARQYSRAQRADFGDFIRRKGFRLD